MAVATFLQRGPCQDFYTSVGKGQWVTAVRSQLLFEDAVAGAAAPDPGQLLVAVLIGSLLRMPYPWANLDRILLDYSGLNWFLFVATAHLGMSRRCMDALCSLRHLAAASFVDLHPDPMRAEDTFVDMAMNHSLAPFKSGASGGSLRQFFKLARAYELMLGYEDFAGRRFDVVVKTRSDVLILPPMNLRDFPGLHDRAFYSVSDVVFLCGRAVAGELLGGLLGRILALVGTDGCVLPIDYDQLLESHLDDVDFFLLNYPCVPGAQADLGRLLGLVGRSAVGRRVHPEVIADFKRLLRDHRREFDGLHRQLPRPAGGPCPDTPAPRCTGAWWHNGTALQDRHSYQGVVNSTVALPGAGGGVESSKTWFYLVHSLRPSLRLRRWPYGGAHAVGHLQLHPQRHSAYCGA